MMVVRAALMISLAVAALGVAAPARAATVFVVIAA